MTVALARVEEQVAALDQLMTARFVTYRTLIDSQAEKVALALAASKEAIDKADIADEKARDRLADDMRQRFDSVNEFRGQQRDVIATFMPRAEFEARILGLSEKVDKLENSETRRTSKTSGATALWGYLVGAVGVIAVVLSFIR